MTTQPTPIRSQPGIQRDGAVFASARYVDGEWCRFQRNLPRKIGGYRRISNDVTGIVRQFHTQAQSGVVYTHVGHANGVQRFTIDTSGNTSAPDDRSPVGFVSDADYNWTFDAMRNSTGSGETLLFAHPARSTLDISSAAEFPVYYGDIYSTTPLVDAGFSVSGGCVVLHPYLFGYGNNGVVSWSDAGDPLNRSSGDAGDATIDAAKIIKGLPVRGGGQSPAGLFWSLTSLIRASYVGSSAIFAFDTVTSTTSVLAANGIIEYDGVFFWCGLDRFSLYNGVVRDLPNDVNSDFFFDNLNYACANKIFAFKVPRFGEIWWCFPKGTATECNHAIVYNVRENSWYDTPLPEGGRSAGIYAQVFRSPLLAGVTVVDLAPGETRITEADVIRETEDDEERITDTGFTTYKIWRHEIGTDAIDGVSVAAIRSFFETGNISLLTSEEPKTNALRIAMLEPDFVQTGDMSVTVVGSINAKAPVVDGEQKSFPAVAATGADEVVKFKEQRRILRLRFESNAIGGDYQMGNPIAHLEPADERFQS